MADILINNWPFVLFVMTLVGLCLLVRLAPKAHKPPYEKRPALLTKSELSFYRALRDAVEEDFAVTAMVRMADLIKVKPQTPKRQAWQNRIHAKHIDFVLCDSESMEAILAIELDDRSHSRPDRQARDRFVNRALSAADLPLLRVPTAVTYDPTELRHSIDNHLN